MTTHKHLSLLLAAIALLASGCGSDRNITSSSQCDGVLNGTETTVDDLFDEDEDGYFDADNVECQQAYALEQLDCDDLLTEVNPGEVEVGCDGLDNDCDPATADEGDSDGDGHDVCAGDCDDNNPDVHPAVDEEVCDGLDNDCDESTPDSEDVDEDTFTSCEDCDDDNAGVNPGTAEVQCDGLDNDCNDLTPDGDDLDGDGMNHCFDCDDDDPLRFPGNTEVCEDGIDQDCDEVDADCPVDWSGLWETTQVTYSCAQGMVDINFSELSVTHSGSSISFTSIGGAQPGTMGGSITGNNFAAYLSIAGTCTEDFDIVGSFTGDDSFTATFFAVFTDSTGLGFCLDCVSQSWSLSGSR